jgi:hypothetical protein
MNTVVCDDLHVSLRVPKGFARMRDSCALSVHGQPFSCLCFAAYVRCEKNGISTVDYIRLLIIVTHLLILVVFNCQAFARISA